MMDEGKKKYLQQNPASRRLLFMDLIDQVDQATNIISLLMRAHKNERPLTTRVISGGFVVESTQFALYQDAGGVGEATKALAEWFAARRLMLYGERNEWLETWPDLLDSSEFAATRTISGTPPEIASNEATGP
jgi:hypothetical protein